MSNLQELVNDHCWSRQGDTLYGWSATGHTGIMTTASVLGAAIDRVKYEPTSGMPDAAGPMQDDAVMVPLERLLWWASQACIYEIREQPRMRIGKNVYSLHLLVYVLTWARVLCRPCELAAIDEQPGYLRLRVHAVRRDPITLMVAPMRDGYTSTPGLDPWTHSHGGAQ